MKTDELQAKIRGAERALRLVWVIAAGAIVFSMLTVTPLVQRVTPDGWDKTAPLLPLVVDAAVIIVVRMDATISGLNAQAGAWPTILRWMTGLFTLGLNIGDSALNGDLVGVCVHAVCPLLLIATSEAIPRYRRTIATAVDQIRREQRAEQERREQERLAREQRAREEREQEQERRERLAREQREQQERSAREQREHEARLAREAREHEAALAQQEADRIARERQAEQERQVKIRLAEIAAQERREQAQQAEKARREQRDREEAQRREQEASARREQQRQAREHQQRADREHPAPVLDVSREHRQLHAVNTPKAAAANTDKVSEEEALEMIREAVNNGKAGIRALARKTGWSPAWVSGRIKEMGGDTNAEESEPAEAEAEQVPA